MNEFNQAIITWLKFYLMGKGLTPEQVAEVVQLKKTPSLEVGDVCFDARKAARLLNMDANVLATEIAEACG